MPDGADTTSEFMAALGDTLLVVEDDDALRRLLEQFLVFEGFCVLTAAHGAEALRSLDKTTPSLVVLDLALPWVNGLEVLATMRGEARLRDVPVLVVTGTMITARDLQSFEPVRLLKKPLNPDAIAPVIHQMLSGHATL